MNVAFGPEFSGTLWTGTCAAHIPKYPAQQLKLADCLKPDDPLGLTAVERDELEAWLPVGLWGRPLRNRIVTIPDNWAA